MSCWTCLFSGRPKPIVITLEYGERHRGGLTYRQLHQQIRQALELEPKVSMRLRCHRPWCRYMLDMPIPERSALPSHDAQCRHLLGTTLSCYLYVHFTTEEDEDDFYDDDGQMRNLSQMQKRRKSCSHQW